MTLGVILILAGIALAFFVMIISIAGKTSTQARGGAVVIIGPFPLIFGRDKQSAKVLLAMSIALVTVLMVLFLIQGHVRV